MTPYYEQDGITIYHGDSLHVLQSLPAEAFDALVTDPPYSSGGQFRGDRMKGTGEKYTQSESRGNYADFAGDTRDQRSFALWCTLWLSESLRVCRPGAPILLFSD